MITFQNTVRASVVKVSMDARENAVRAPPVIALLHLMVHKNVRGPKAEVVRYTSLISRFQLYRLTCT